MQKCSMLQIKLISIFVLLCVINSEFHSKALANTTLWDYNGRCHRSALRAHKLPRDCIRISLCHFTTDPIHLYGLALEQVKPCSPLSLSVVCTLHVTTLATRWTVMLQDYFTCSNPATRLFHSCSVSSTHSWRCPTTPAS